MFELEVCGFLSCERKRSLKNDWYQSPQPGEDQEDDIKEVWRTIGSERLGYCLHSCWCSKIVTNRGNIFVSCQKCWQVNGAIRTTTQKWRWYTYWRTLLASLVFGVAARDQPSVSMAHDSGMVIWIMAIVIITNFKNLKYQFLMEWIHILGYFEQIDTFKSISLQILRNWPW